MQCCHAAIVQSWLAVLLLFGATVKSEFFTATSGLKHLISSEEKLANILENYLKVEEERIQKLKTFRQQYAELLKTAERDKEIFLSNPVNAYVLLKQLTRDWTDALDLIESTEAQELVESPQLEDIKFPDESDLSGAATGLIRLQHIYALQTEAIAEGRINGTKPSPPLTAADCYELGKQAYASQYKEYALKWMTEALKRLDTEDIQSVDRVNAMEYITFSAFEVGNFTLGLSTLKEIVKVDQDYPRLYENLHYYQIKKDEWENRNEVEKAESPVVAEVEGKWWTEHELLQRYKHLCRGEPLKSTSEQSLLSCYRTENSNTYLVLQPLKVEELNLRPRIVMFHDVISEAEGEVIKELASPRLERAVIQNTDTGEIEASTDRISKSTVLGDYENEVIMRINRRIEDITGLSAQSAEDINVINYGIGGHYEPHFDFALSKKQANETFGEAGNRIATWIFYLSEVFSGGSTVFPVIGVEVKPVKGAAAFWYNLQRNGDGDKRTLHAACPVLAGSKWVSNKWLHEVGQEFRRPCSLNPLE